MPSSKLKLPLLAAALLSLTNCAGGSSSPAAAPPCGALTLQSYSAAQQSAVADEMEAAPASATWPDFIRDYGRLRSGIRACQSDRN